MEQGASRREEDIKIGRKFITRGERVTMEISVRKGEGGAVKAARVVTIKPIEETYP